MPVTEYVLYSACPNGDYIRQNKMCLRGSRICPLLYIIGNYYHKRLTFCPLLYPLKKYYTQSADQDDLISIGTIGLIKGISSFDASKGARLATYSARCIENATLS